MWWGDSCNLDFTLLSDPGAKVSALYGTALDLPFLGKFSNRQTYIISPVSDGQTRFVWGNVAAPEVADDGGTYHIAEWQDHQGFRGC